MTLLAALHSVAGTFHWAAAAATSISRAMAPPSRTYWLLSRMPRLPPVQKFFHTRLRFRFSPGVGYSQVTLFQSHSSSSAPSWSRPVSVPCPISERAMRMTTVSSGRITTQALTSGEPSAARTTAGPPKGISSPIARPVPSAALPITKARRLSVGIWFMAASSNVPRGVDRLAHLLESAAAANIGDGFVDVLVGRLRFFLEKRSHRHDHSGLAISALRDVVVDPGFLYLVQCAIGGQSFDGGDLLATGVADQYAARAHRNAIDMDGTGPALCNAATVFGAGKADIFPDCP